MTNERIPAQQAHDELAAEIKSEEDLQTMQQWQDEIDQERAEAHAELPKQAPELVVQPDGTVEAAKNVVASMERGEETSGAYSGNRRA